MLDPVAVSAWAETHIAGFDGPLAATKYAGGQSNPTYRLQSPSGSYVLRRKPPGVLLRSAHAVEREFRVQQALADTDVPVARMLALCEDDSIVGSAFYVMSEVAGVNFDDPRLPDLAPDQRDRVIDAMCRTLAAIHAVDLRATGLADYGAPANYISRQIARWTEQYRATQTEDIAEMEALMAWLPGHIPDRDQQRSLVHGDYRLDNLLFDRSSLRCKAVLDWELSTIGHPYADLASVIMQWSMPTGPDGRGLAGVDRAALGLWSDQRFIDTYCQHRGLPGIAQFGFYLAFCHFRMAAILQGVKKRSLDGNASDPSRGLRLGAHVPAFARAGLSCTTIRR